MLPRDRKSGTIFKARFYEHPTIQAVAPGRVIGELMDIVFRVKQFFDANFAMVLVSTALFLVLVVLLSLRIRQREFETLFKLVHLCNISVHAEEKGNLALIVQNP